MVNRKKLTVRMSTTKDKRKSIIVTASAAKDRSAKYPKYIIVYDIGYRYGLISLYFETARRASGCRVTCHSATNRGTPGAHIYINIIYAPFSARHEFIYLYTYIIYNIYRYIPKHAQTLSLCTAVRRL